jgi:NADPH:quinone reductase-like Zn-dependent oxidoreductase
VSQRLRPFLTKWSKQDLHVVKELIEVGKVTPVIDRTYPLSKAPRRCGIWKQVTPEGRS